MPIIGLQGIRGGVGTTSITAGLAWALHQQGEQVLIVDMCQSNQLFLHFNGAIDWTSGWARAQLDQQPWQQAALRYTQGLDLLPFGQLSRAEYQQWQQHHSLLVWINDLAAFINNDVYEWVLLDIPADAPASFFAVVNRLCGVLTVVTADANNHIRLHQRARPAEEHLLLNQLAANSRLQQDLQQYWRQHLPNILPLAIHRDEAMAEALAAKQPVGEYSALSLAADELKVLAIWCLAHFNKQRL